MKNNLLQRGCILFFFYLSTLTTNAQEGDKNVLQKITNEKGIPNFIQFTDKSTYKSSDFQQIFKDQLGLKENTNFAKMKSETDKLGMSHDKFQLFHKGLKVEFSTYTLHSLNGKLKSMTGEFYKTDLANTIPKLTTEQAFERAIQQIGAQKYMWDSPEEAKLFNYSKPVGELLLLPVINYETTSNDENNLRLAYKFDIYATVPVSRGDIYIDAVTGESLFYNATIKHLGKYGHGKSATVPKNHKKLATPANASTRYSGTQTIQTTLSGSNYILADGTRGNGINTYNLQKGTNYNAAINFTDADNNWTAAEYNNANKDNGALDAHWGAEKTYDYWSTVHGRNSYDNAGAILKSYVHYSVAYDNAYWNGSVMTYGDGSGTKFDILTSLDVVGHEIGHAVCEKTAGLAYQKESGAMNEALSDIWGACIENFAAPSKATWLIGEDIEKRPGHLSLRSLSNPKTEGQPDTYGGTNWINPNCFMPMSSNDYCGVHTNSGVLNHWFYILAVGKSGTNDKGNSYSVSGITLEKAAKITFRLESLYLTSNSTYANARTYGIQSAAELYGAGSAEVIATTNAFYAVGVGAAYSGPTDTTAPTAPMNLTATGTTDTSTNLSWMASMDNVAVTGYNVYNGVNLVTTVSGTTYTVTGLTAQTNYTFTVKAKDAAGNLSSVSNEASTTTLSTPADITPPTAPTGLAANGTTSTATNLTWTASTDNVAVTGYNVYNGATLLTTVTATSYTVTGLTPSTAYTFTVQAKDATGNLSDTSNAVSVTTAQNVLTYCTSKGNSATYEFIDNVSIGGISNATGANGGYGNFTNLTGNLPYGTNTIIFSAGFRFSSRTEYWGVWIDLNKNGTFETTEKMVSRSSSSSANLSNTFTIPASALAGTTRMRVSMKRSSAPAACGNFSSGEVEDYTVNIGSTTLVPVNDIAAIETAAQNKQGTFLIYPNPTNEILHIQFSDDNQHREASYTIINISGQAITSGKITENFVNISTLKCGVYFIEINDNYEINSRIFIKK